MARDAAENLVRRKAADARQEPDETASPFLWGMTQTEELTPLDRPTRDEDRTQKFWEETRRDE